MIFETIRLRCRSLTVDEYRKFELSQEPEWVDCKNPYRHLIDGPSPLSHRIPRVKQNPEFAEIGLLLAIEKKTKEIVGSAGFHDFPTEDGMIEIGFGIVTEKQNQGLGQELLKGMWINISKNPQVKTLRYTVSPDNGPSLHIIRSLGFTLVGEQIDPEDGVELIYEQTTSDFFRRNKIKI